MGSYDEQISFCMRVLEEFPAPREASGVSYEEKMGLDMYLSKFPAPREDWVVSYFRRRRKKQ